MTAEPLSLTIQETIDSMLHTKVSKPAGKCIHAKEITIGRLMQPPSLSLSQK